MDIYVYGVASNVGPRYCRALFAKEPDRKVIFHQKSPTKKRYFIKRALQKGDISSKEP